MCERERERESLSAREQTLICVGVWGRGNGGGDNILELAEMTSLICSFYLSLNRSEQISPCGTPCVFDIRHFCLAKAGLFSATFRNNNKATKIIIIITTTTTIIIIIIIILLKGIIRDFFTISSLRRELSPTRTLLWPGRNRVQITCNTSGAYHVQHVVCDVVPRDSSAIKFDRVEIAFILALKGKSSQKTSGPKYVSCGFKNRFLCL